jgi:hypothetical protein
MLLISFRLQIISSNSGVDVLGETILPAYSKMTLGKLDKDFLDIEFGEVGEFKTTGFMLGTE